MTYFIPSCSMTCRSRCYAPIRCTRGCGEIPRDGQSRNREHPHEGLLRPLDTRAPLPVRSEVHISLFEFSFLVFRSIIKSAQGGKVVSRANQRVFHREVLRTPSHSNSIDEVRCYRLETVRFFKVPDNSIVRFEAFQSASFDNATAATSLRRCP